MHNLYNSILADGLQAVSDEEEFYWYFERFIKYVPGTPYHIKTGYDKGFVQCKTKKGNPAGLGGPWKIQTVERHLNPERWAEEHDKPYTPFWLGLLMPKQTRDHALDLDAKEFVLGRYQIGGHTYPISCPTVAHYRKLKQIYDAFPGRIWCVSSRTLGIHVWQKTKLTDTLQLHAQDKEILSQIGIDCEVHPMPGRCFRRPFGTDYITITPTSRLEIWQQQIKYYLDDGRTPPFEHIVRTLLDLTQKNWLRSQIPRATIIAEPTDLPEILAEVTAWVDQGCPDGAATHVSASPAVAEAIGPAVGLDSRKRVKTELPPEARNKNWVFWLEGMAQDGLPDNVSAGTACHEFSKWFYWVELYDQPNKVDLIQDALERWMKEKHNGHCQRITDGNFEDVKRQIANAIKLAARLDPMHRNYTLYHSALTRQKREQGGYTRVMNILPIMDASSQPEATQRLSPGSIYKGMVKDSLLPPETLAQITQFINSTKKRKVKGEYPIIEIARQVFHLLWEKKGSAKLSEALWQEICRTTNRSTILTYKNDLVIMGLLKSGWHKSIIRGKSCSRYTMTEECKRVYENYFQQQRQEQPA